MNKKGKEHNRFGNNPPTNRLNTSLPTVKQRNW